VSYTSLLGKNWILDAVAGSMNDLMIDQNRARKLGTLQHYASIKKIPFLHGILPADGRGEGLGKINFFFSYSHNIDKSFLGNTLRGSS
jgi:hypothetical protein